MNKKWLVILFKVIYEIVALTLTFYFMKYLCEFVI